MQMANKDQEALFYGAETLMFMKSQKLTESEARELRTLIENTRQSRNHIIVQQESNGGNNNDVPQDFPLIPSLTHFVQDCSSVVQKKLRNSDIKKDQNRLLIPKNVAKESFVPLLRDDEDMKEGIAVTVYDGNGNDYAMKFKIWAQNKYYVLTGGWNHFVKVNMLKAEEDSVKVWMFRHSQTHNLCFLVLKQDK